MEDQFHTSTTAAQQQKISVKNDDIRKRKTGSSDEDCNRFNNGNSKQIGKSKSKLNKTNSNKRDDDIHFNGPTMRNGPPPPPMIDRTKKPKPSPPALPKKLGGQKLATLSSSQETEQEPFKFNSTNGTSTSSQSSRNNGSGRSSSERDDGEGTVKSSSSKKSQGSLGTNSSGTHDYQEINSDICEAIHRNHENRLEQEKHIQQQQQKQFIHQQQHQQHKLFLKHQQQKRLLQENLHNAQKTRGRSMDPKRKSAQNGSREGRSSGRGRSNGPGDRRDRSVGRIGSESTQNLRTERRSKSSEQLHQETRLSRQQQYILREQELRENQLRESIMMTQGYNPDQDPMYLIDPALHDPRIMIGPNGIHPSLLDPRLVSDPRLIESHHMMDPRMVDPRYDHPDGGMMYPLPDVLQFPHLMNYPEHPIMHQNNMPPILPPEEFNPAYHMYPYDIPYLPEHGPALTPEEIHILHSQGRIPEGNFINSHQYMDYPQGFSTMQYPIDYRAMDYRQQILHNGGYPLPPHEFHGYSGMEGMVPIPPPLPPHPQHLLMGSGADFSPPSAEEAKLTIERMVK